MHLNFEKEAIMLYNCFHFIHKELLMNFTNFYQNLKHLIFSAELKVKSLERQEKNTHINLYRHTINDIGLS